MEAVDLPRDYPRTNRGRGRPFTAAQNRELSARKKPARTRAWIAIQIFQRALLKVISEPVQEIAGTEIIERKPKASEIASAATAWDRLEERRRILLGVGAPKPVPAANDPSRQKPIDVTPSDHAITLDAPPTSNA